MPKTETASEYNFSVFYLFQWLKMGWRWMFAGALVGLLVAMAMLVLIPNQYEAIAVVQVGQVGQVGQYVGIAVEPVTQAIERMKTFSFQQNVVSISGENFRSISFQLLKSTVVQGSSALIEIKAKAARSEIAKKIVEISIQELAKRHAEIAKPLIERINTEAVIAHERLARAEAELGNLNDLQKITRDRDDNFSQILLLTSLRLQKESEVYNQRQILINLKAALSPPFTEPTKAIEEVFVSGKPISPKKGVILVLGIIGGLLLGLMWLFVSSAWMREREQRSEVAFE